MLIWHGHCLYIGMAYSALSPRAQYGYIPGLNGIRAISVLIVILSHMGLKNIIPGGFGVTIFFFVSGFLITRLLIAESQANGAITLKKFYMRRFIRLYPALLFMVFGTSVFFLMAGWGGPQAWELFAAVFYGNNFFQITSGIGNMPWTHLWSLAVEEHFYLIFPAFLVLLRGHWPRALNYLLIGLGLALIWRVIIYTQTSLIEKNYSYMMTDTRMDSLIWGCVLSLMLHVHGTTKRLSWLLGYGPAALALILLIVSFVYRDESFRETARYSLQGLALFILFLNLFFTDKFSWVMPILEWKPLAWIGTLSYGLYLWHIPIIEISNQIGAEGVVSYVIILTASLGAAAFSYYVVEKRFLNLRQHFGSQIPKKHLVRPKTSTAA